MIHKQKDKTILWFEDITSLAVAKVSDVNQHIWNGHLSSGRLENSSWVGVHGGVAEIRKLVELYGWEHGANKGKEMLGEFKAPKLPYFKRKRIRASEGHALDIHRVLCGDLAHAWEASKKVQSNTLAMRGHVNIVVDIGAHGGISGDKYFWRGAVACVLTKALIESGRQVRIIAVDCTQRLTPNTSGCYNKVIVATVLKPFHAPLDVNRMFSCTALSGFYRYYYFKACCILDTQIRRDFGTATEFSLDDLLFFLDDTPCLTIGNIWNKAQANNRLQTLSKQIEGEK